MKKTLVLAVILIIAMGIFGYVLYVKRYATPSTVLKEVTPEVPSAPAEMPEAALTNIPVAPPVAEPVEPELPTLADVIIANFSFSPATVTIAAGSRVKWSNRDLVGHTVTGDGWGSSLLTQGESFSYRFDQPGIYTYHCTPHPSMTGTIIVK